MHRRDFLKLSGLLSAAVWMPANSLAKVVSLPVEVEAQGLLFRGTPEGRIYVSANRGKDWHLHTNFGSHVAVHSLASGHRDQVQAELGVADYRFALALAPDGRRWKTM